MSQTIALVLDLIMVGLLAATIAYAIILNKQIIKLRESRGEMNELIKGLNEAMTRAESGVRGLKKAAADTGDDLQRSVTRAQALRDELEFMIDAGDALANRLGSVGEERARSSAAAAARAPARSGLSARPALSARPLVEDPDHDMDDAPPSRREEFRVDALRAEALRAEAQRADPPPRRVAPPAESRDAITREGENLSRAERELLQAIENAGKGIG